MSEAKEKPGGTTQVAEEGELHWVLKKDYPVALCGHIVSCDWDAEPSTKGLDRCYKCMKVAKDMGLA